MDETLKSSPAGKFMLHRRDFRWSREFLRVVPQTRYHVHEETDFGDLGNIDLLHQQSYSENHL
jgi:hypothetical protein